MVIVGLALGKNIYGNFLSIFNGHYHAHNKNLLVFQ
jgi:hypothetical protein